MTFGWWWPLSERWPWWPGKKSFLKFDLLMLFPGPCQQSCSPGTLRSHNWLFLCWIHICWQVIPWGFHKRGPKNHNGDCCDSHSSLSSYLVIHDTADKVTAQSHTRWDSFRTGWSQLQSWCLLPHVYQNPWAYGQVWFQQYPLCQNKGLVREVDMFREVCFNYSNVLAMLGSWLM